MSTPQNLLCKFVPTPESKPEPKLRHEFVGMMFAVAIAEVGMQAANLVQARNWVHLLPAFSHLILATAMIATSWVGWTLSPAPGAQHDVRGILQWEFLVLLLDVLLVIVYFILVRSVDAPVSTVVFWILVIFLLYFCWDVLTKIILYLKYMRTEAPEKQPKGNWFPDYGSRMLPTLICLLLLWIIRRPVEAADRPHLLTADIALLALVLLFRALKDVISAFFPTAELPKEQAEKEREMARRAARKKWAIVWTVGCVLFMSLGSLWTKYSWCLPLPQRVVDEIKKEPSDKNSHSETHPPAGRPEQPNADQKP